MPLTPNLQESFGARPVTYPAVTVWSFCISSVEVVRKTKRWPGTSSPKSVAVEFERAVSIWGNFQNLASEAP